MLKILILSCWLIATTASAELITGHRATDRFAWDYQYDISLVNDIIRVHTELMFFPAEGATQLEIDAVLPIWEQAIEAIWSRPDIVFDITFGPAYDYFVYVVPGRTRNMSIWGLRAFPDETIGTLAAHEYGHMLGLWDEYFGGTTDPAGALIDASSIMGNARLTSHPYTRHYEEMYEWADAYRSNRVPEPGTLVLVILGLMLVTRLSRAELRP